VQHLVLQYSTRLLHGFVERPLPPITARTAAGPAARTDRAGIAGASLAG
jgi:hypothetical protein